MQQRSWAAVWKTATKPGSVIGRTKCLLDGESSRAAAAVEAMPASESQILVVIGLVVENSCSWQIGDLTGCLAAKLAKMVVEKKCWLKEVRKKSAMRLEDE